MEQYKAFKIDHHPYYNTVRRARKRNFNKFEKELLQKLVKRYLPIIDNKRTDGDAVAQRLNAWKKITQEFNSNLNVIPASLKRIRRWFQNMKQRIKSGQTPQIEIDTESKPNLAEIAGVQIDAEDVEETGCKVTVNRRQVLSTEAKMVQKRKFSAAEKNILLRIVQKYKSIINDLKTDPSSIATKLNTWKKITKEFNIHPNTDQPASLRQLRGLWQTFKYGPKVSVKTENDVNLTEITSSVIGQDEEAHLNLGMEESDTTSADCLQSEETESSSVHITNEEPEEEVIPLLYPEQNALFMAKSSKLSPTNSLSNPEESTQDPLVIIDNPGVSETEELDDVDCTDQKDSCLCHKKDYAQLLLQEKIKLIKTYTKNAKEESRMRLQILDLQLTQERIKTKMLLSNNGM